MTGNFFVCVQKLQQGIALADLICGAGGIGVYGFPVESEACGATNVGAEGADVGSLQLFKDGLAGMTITIVQSAGDDGALGSDAGEELRPG